MITTQVTAGSRPCPNNHMYMCAYSSCKGETPFQQWRWTTSTVCLTGTTAEQLQPIPITTRKLEFGPRQDFWAHTLTRKTYQYSHFMWNFKHSHQKYHCYKQKSKGWIVTNDHWTPEHMETPPFTQTIHHWASCVNRAGVVATLYSHSTMLSLFFNIIMLTLCLYVQLFHRSTPTHSGPRNRLFWEGKQMKGSTCQFILSH